MDRHKILGLFVIVFATTQIGCKKENGMRAAIDTYESKRNKQLQIVAQLGLNMGSITLHDSGNIKLSDGPLVFNSIAEAKAFFRPLKAIQGISYREDGTSFKRQKLINVLKYVRENANLINSWTDEYVLNAPYNIRHSTNSASSREGGGGCVIEDEPFRLTDDGCGGGGQPGQPTPGLADMTRWVLWSGYHLSFNYTFGATGTLTVTNVTTNLVGLTPGISWTTSNTQVFTNYPGSALIYFDVMGYQNYNIIVEGLGTIFTQKVHLIGIFNTNTGVYTILATS
jgi:hypothetical protein